MRLSTSVAVILLAVLPISGAAMGPAIEEILRQQIVAGGFVGHRPFIRIQTSLLRPPAVGYLRAQGSVSTETYRARPAI